jgi:hypothetical protein
MEVLVQTNTCVWMKSVSFGVSLLQTNTNTPIQTCPIYDRPPPRSLGLSATSQQYFSLRPNQPPATSQQYSSLRTNQHQPSATSQPNWLHVRIRNFGNGAHHLGGGVYIGASRGCLLHKREFHKRWPLRTKYFVLINRHVDYHHLILFSRNRRGNGQSQTAPKLYTYIFSWKAKAWLNKIRWEVKQNLDIFYFPLGKHIAYTMLFGIDHPIKCGVVPFFRNEVNMPFFSAHACVIRS